MNHPSCGQDSAAYVLGALDPDELLAFRRHLRGCTVCQTEVEGFGAVAGELALAVPQYHPSPELRRRVVAEVRADVRRRAARPAGSILHRPGWAASVAMATLVVLVVAVGLTFGGPRTTGSGPSHAAPGAGAARVFTAQVGAAQVVVDRGHGELVVHHLLPLGDTQVYEVWLQHGRGGSAQPTRALFQVSADGSAAVDVPGNMRTVTEVMVTAEPAGGTAVPTSQPVVVARTA